MVEVLDPVLFQRSAEGTRALLVAEIEEVFSSLNLNRPEASRDELLRVMPELVSSFGSAASQVAMDYYDEARFMAGVAGSFRAIEAVSPYQDVVEPLVRRAAGALFTDYPVDALDTLTSTAPKYALGAPRQTVLASVAGDPEAAGWRRETRGATCNFCKALAARGAVYRKGSDNFAAHAHCDCVSVPSWDPSAPEVPVEAYALSRRTSQMPPAVRARHRAMTSQWIKSLA